MVSEDSNKESKGIADKDADDLKDILFFRIGGNTLACLSSQAARVITVPVIVPLLQKHPVISGVFSYRGRVIAAADISKMLPLMRDPGGNYRWVVVIKGKNFLCGVLADEIIGIEPCPTKSIIIDYLASGFFKTRLGTSKKSAIFFDTEALLAEEELLVRQ